MCLYTSTWIWANFNLQQFSYCKFSVRRVRNITLSYINKLSLRLIYSLPERWRQIIERLYRHSTSIVWILNITHTLNGPDKRMRIGGCVMMIYDTRRHPATLYTRRNCVCIFFCLHALVTQIPIARTQTYATIDISYLCDNLIRMHGDHLVKHRWISHWWCNQKKMTTLTACVCHVLLHHTANRRHRSECAPTKHNIDKWDSSKINKSNTQLFHFFFSYACCDKLRVINLFQRRLLQIIFLFEIETNYASSHWAS